MDAVKIRVVEIMYGEVDKRGIRLKASGGNDFEYVVEEANRDSWWFVSQ